MTDYSWKRSRLRPSFFSVSFSSFTLLVAGSLPAQQASPRTPAPTPAQANSQPAPAASTSTAPASTSAATPPSNPTETNPAETAERSKAILQHLNAVLRFYHDVGSPTIQKVGEPSDLIYRDQAATLASQIAGFAFQSAKAESVLMATPTQADQATPQDQSQAQRLQTTRDSVAQRIVELKAQDDAL